MNVHVIIQADTMWIPKYIKAGWAWADANPRKAIWISWLKGLVHGLILAYFLF